MKNKHVKPDNKEQSQRFIEKATQIKADDDKERFEKASSAIIKRKKRSL